MRVLVGLSGGVDSSVAAALLLGEGHEVVTATMKLWGGKSDSGCCSASDVDDARRVAAKLGVEHHVFNFAEEFEARVVQPYADAHASGRTPNPCVECNRHLKFRRFLDRAVRLGFDAVATGHHARIRASASAPGPGLFRGRDQAKDQSYVLSMLTSEHLSSILLPVGDLTKTEVRRRARELGLATAAKPDSQEVCFVASGPGSVQRERFLAARIPLHPASVVEARSGAVLGSVPAMELVTVGQRRGLGALGRERRYVLRVDAATATVSVGDEADLAVRSLALTERTWTHGELAPGSPVLVQASAHGRAVAGIVTEAGVAFGEGGMRAVAPGQTVALYLGDEVAGSGIAS